MPIVPPDIVLIVLGLLVGISALPLAFGRVGPNRYYGIRMPAAFTSRQNWYALNRFGGARLMRFGIVVAAAGVLLHLVPALPFWVPIAGLFGALALLLFTVRSISKYASSL